MDHHIVPPDGVVLPISVPYKAPKEKYYDGQGFFNYPSRQGWTENELHGEDGFGHRTKEDIEIFFQTWLYFGFVIEVFKAVGIVVTTDDFIITASSTSSSSSSTLPVVSTAKLPGFLAQWRNLWPIPQGISPDCSCSSRVEPHKVKCTAKPCWKEFNPARLSLAWATVHHILDRVCYFLDRNCTISREQQVNRKASPASWPLSDEVSTSIIVLGSTIRQAVITYWQFPHMGPKWTSGSSRILKAALEAKYCPSDAALIMEDLPIDGQYYLAASEGRGKAYLNAHSQCSEARCVATMNEKTYETQHAPGCFDEACRLSFANPCSSIFIESVVKVINGGGTPVTHWDKDRKQLSVEDHNPEDGLAPPYVAISHVWADGMGNPAQNRLPDCQLSRIQAMVNELDIPNHQGATRVGFWMDTLCIPVVDQYKKQKKESIGRMRHIYKEASVVLVLDAWMQSIRPASTPIERCARLYTSNWIRRLWTLQEGMLNGHVFLQWTNGAEKLDALTSARIAWEEDAQSSGIIVSFPKIAASKVSLHFLFMQHAVEMIQKGERPAEMRVEFYVPLCDMLGPRATTRESDETVCLGTVLGLDPMPFLNIENDEDDEDVVQRRMEAFLRVIGTFHASIIFNSYRKLQRDGVRWAPRSLLRHRTAELGQVFQSKQKGQITTVNQYSGLAVKFPGFLVRGNTQLRGSRGMTVSLKGPESDEYVVQVVVSEEEESTTVDGNDPGSLYAVIWPGDLVQLGQEGCRGIIGQVQAGVDHRINGEDITVVRYQCGVMITKLEANVQTEEAVLFRKQDSQWLVM